MKIYGSDAAKVIDRGGGLAWSNNWMHYGRRAGREGGKRA